MPAPADARLLARVLRSGLLSEEQCSTVLSRLLSSPATSISELLVSAAGLSREHLEALGKQIEADAVGSVREGHSGPTPPAVTISEDQSATSRSGKPLENQALTFSAVRPEPPAAPASSPWIPVAEPDHAGSQVIASAPDQNQNAATVLVNTPTTLSSTPLIEGLDRYQLGRQLGHGGLGRVWHARDQHLAREVALKELLPGRQENPRAVARFIREARITGRLTHPGIVSIHELGCRTEGTYYYTMQLLEGKNYRDTIRSFHQLPADAPERPLRQNELLRVYLDVCNALAFAHSKHIIHRDLKPANIMLGDFGEAIVVDWGLAKVLATAEDATPEDSAASEELPDPLREQLTHVGAVVGTPSYMPPEQALGQVSQLDARSDIYALGVILYEVLVGVPPFTGKSTHEILANVRVGAFLPPRSRKPDVPAALQAICLKAMARIPADRYASARDLAADVARWLAGEPVSVHREPWPTRARRWARRHRALCLSSLTAFLMIVLGISTWLGFEWWRVEQVRGAAQHLLDEGQSAVLAQQFDLARLPLSNVLSLIQHEQGLLDLEGAARELLERAEVRLAQVRAAELAQRTYTRFQQLRETALAHGTGFTGLDVQEEQQTAATTAEQALRLFYPTLQDAQFAPEHRPYLTVEQQQELLRGRRELLLVLAEVALTRQNPGAALRYLDWAALNSEPLKAVALRRSLCLRLAGKKEAAAQEQLRADALHPKEASDFFFLGKVLHDQEMVAEAGTHFEQALRQDPEHFWAQYFLALTHLRQEKPARAVAHLTACASRRPRLHWIFLVRGYAHGLLGQFDQAHADFHKAETLCSGPDYGLLVNRGSTFILQALHKPAARDQSKLAAAVADFERAIQVKPEQYQAYLNLARAFQEQNQFEQALDAANAAVEKAAGLPAPHATRARIRLSRKELTAALTDFEQALQLTRVEGRPRALLHLERARILYQQGRYEPALQASAAALKSQPDYAEAHRLRAESLLALGQPALAIKAFDDYFRHEGKPSADVYQARGLLHAQTGNYAAAMTDYTRALELDPTAPQMRVRRGWAYLLSAPRLAEADFAATLRVIPRNGDAYTGLGYARVQMGKYREAIQDAEEGVQHSAKVAGIVFNAACIYAQAVVHVEKDTANRQRKELSEKYRVRAVALIRAALQTLPAADRAPFVRDVVQRDTALEPLHQYPAFQELVMTRK